MGLEPCNLHYAAEGFGSKRDVGLYWFRVEGYGSRAEALSLARADWSRGLPSKVSTTAPEESVHDTNIRRLPKLETAFHVHKSEMRDQHNAEHKNAHVGALELRRLFCGYNVVTLQEDI